ERSRSDTVRLPVLRALGTFVDRRAAEALVRRMETAGDEPEIFRAAGDALVYMTGYVEFGRDLDRWRQWFAQASQLSDADFRSQLLNARAARFDRTIQRYAALADEISDILAQQHAALPPDQRGEFLLRLRRRKCAPSCGRWSAIRIRKCACRSRRRSRCSTMPRRSSRC
ncbi:MAG TPA: hypothetical protein PKB10_12255, partial [Tepidisphaeraceae bacterium]|nr:hypothetical protein [Tepidisphaeraceae bacterium]